MKDKRQLIFINVRINLMTLITKKKKKEIQYLMEVV